MKFQDIRQAIMLVAELTHFAGATPAERWADSIARAIADNDEKAFEAISTELVLMITHYRASENLEGMKS